ncbi:MAG TPA: radical SAM protein [Nitrospirota bacterium]|nr:radical SAM protein [Nitrospirota bacterium]
MKLTLIMPRAKRIAKKGTRLRLPPFGLTMVAALTPKEFEISLLDENVRDIDLAAKTDLAGIASFTSNVERGYEIADEYRRRGIPVVMGGFHASAMPDEALRHADAVVIGEAENIWRKVIEDFKRGAMKGPYKSERFHDMKGLPHPRLDLLPREAWYTLSQMVQTMRGCPYQCEFCSTSAFWGHTFRTRPVDEIIEEVRQLDRSKLIMFVDDDVAGVPRFAKELFEKLIPLKIKWVSQAGIGIAKDDELLSLARRSGCQFLFIGFETMDEKTLKAAHKYQNHPAQYRELIRKIHDQNIVLQAAFVLGLDEDRKEVFERIDRLFVESKADCINLNILYPYPGSDIRERLLKEGRITSNDWTNYVYAGVNYLPKNMTQQELHEGYLWLLKKHTTFWAILKRTIRSLFAGRHIGLTASVSIGTRRNYNHARTTPNPIKAPREGGSK